MYKGFIMTLIANSDKIQIRAVTQSVLSSRATYKRGEQLSSSNRFTFALAANSTGMADPFHMAAQCKGDSCIKSSAFTFAPASINTFTTEGELDVAARCKGVLLPPSRASMFAPASRSALTTESELYSAAMCKAVN